MKRFLLLLLIANCNFLASAQVNKVKPSGQMTKNETNTAVGIITTPTSEKSKKTKMNSSPEKLNETDKKFLEKCVQLAEEAYKAGDSPFGSVLVDDNNNILATARNRINEKTVMAHPEIELAQWALDNLTREERRKATMYTTGEHCPMCAGAHAWSEIHRLVFLSSAKQLSTWQEKANMPEAPINFIPSREIIKNVKIEGPFEGALFERIKELQFKTFKRNK